jgi:hypothetical protein
MAHSIFYSMGSGRRFPISLLAVETYAVHIEDAKTDDELFDLFVSIVTEICGVPRPTTEDVHYFVERLQEIQKELTESIDTPSKGTKKGWGTNYIEFLQKLSLDSVILRMVGYDFEAAKKLYCDLDRTDTLKLVRDYTSGLMQEGLMLLESTMYGFGNSYAEDKGRGQASQGNVKTHDIRTPEGLAALRRLGF